MILIPKVSAPKAFSGILKYTAANPVGLELERLLLTLDRIGLVELRAGNRVKLLCARSVLWSEGRLANTYRQEALREFLKQEIRAKPEASVFRTGELSPSSVRMLESALSRIKADFDRMAKADSSLPKDNVAAMALYFTARPLVYTLFQGLKRNSAKS